MLYSANLLSLALCARIFQCPASLLAPARFRHPHTQSWSTRFSSPPSRSIVAASETDTRSGTPASHDAKECFSTRLDAFLARHHEMAELSVRSHHFLSHPFLFGCGKVHLARWHPPWSPVQRHSSISSCCRVSFSSVFLFAAVSASPPRDDGLGVQCDVISPFIFTVASAHSSTRQCSSASARGHLLLARCHPSVSLSFSTFRISLPSLFLFPLMCLRSIFLAPWRISSCQRAGFSCRAALRML